MTQAVNEIEVWSFDDLEIYIQLAGEKVKVINFWATWCAPCIKELPLFETLNTSHKNDVEILLVNLDYSEQLEKKVKPFVKEQGLTSRVVLLGDENYNDWIDKVHPSWSGAIPATLFVTVSGDKIFKEKEFEGKELSNLVSELINK